MILAFPQPPTFIKYSLFSYFLYSNLFNFDVATFLATIIFLAAAGNILVCVAIYTERSLRRIGNLFLASLAIADLFVSLLVMTFASVNDILGKHELWRGFASISNENKRKGFVDSQTVYEIEVFGIQFGFQTRTIQYMRISFNCFPSLSPTLSSSRHPLDLWTLKIVPDRILDIRCWILRHMDRIRRDVLDIIHFKLVRHIAGSLYSHQGSPEVIWQTTWDFSSLLSRLALLSSESTMKGSTSHRSVGAAWQKGLWTVDCMSVI